MSNIVLNKKPRSREEKNAERLNNIRSTRTEDIKKRTVFEKHYINNDGTHTIELNSMPIHVYNSKTKQYDDIDNTLVDNSESTMCLKANNFNLEFNKHLSDGRLLKISNGKNNIVLNYHGKREREGKILLKSFAKAKNTDRLTNSLIYENIAPNVSLEYIINKNKVKENIIIYEKQESYEFNFSLEIGNLKARLSSDKKNVEIIDDKNKIHFIIPSPLMVDANNNESNDVKYEFQEEDGILLLTIKASEEWINQDSCILPVKIDPQIIANYIEEQNMTHFRIVDKVATREYTEGEIGEKSSKKYSHLINIFYNEYAKLDIVSVSINLYSSFVDLIAKIKVSQYNGTIQNANTTGSFEYDDSKCSPLGEMKKTWQAYSTKFSYDITALFNIWITQNKKIGTIVMSSDYTFLINSDLPTLSITFRIEIMTPNDYLKIGKKVVVELVSNFSAEIDLNGTKKMGPLTTYIDNKEKKVIQKYQLGNQIFIRESYENNVWSEWKKTSLRAEFSNDCLYLSDEI